MKKAVICYPGVSISDIAAFLTTTDLIDQNDEPWEFCSYLPINNGFPGLSLTTSHVGLPLSNFDTVFIPGTKPGATFFDDSEWFQWLATINQNAKIIAVRDGELLAQQAELNRQSIININNSAAAAFIAGLYWVQKNKDKDTAARVAKREGLEKEWEQFLLQQFPRTARYSRRSAETDISVELELDGSGKYEIDTGIPFLDHMLAQIARHGMFNLKMKATGDLEIDTHHTLEDSALVLGEAFRLASGDRKGIQRMASATVPMDESLAAVTIDFSGRPYAVLETKWKEDVVGNISTSLIEHFLESFATEARCNLYVQVIAGSDNHHMSEAIFKAMARALDTALTIDQRRAGQIPSTKEVLF